MQLEGARFPEVKGKASSSPEFFFRVEIVFGDSSFPFKLFSSLTFGSREEISLASVEGKL